ncbi:hypothetical protein SDRG_13979 [Saprolegnia diclina VS20]|uniref:Agenet domain-containing protein n=1 Tax=Saprolegnia diclina (strain VS20) TaxID=1156394 RepID=T0R896_SAPDV|nr:hypothetical protein SDRG_13979 [Saprolegnia diclina VS20]EQC28298.1 hypothetical protein SDRG_13979 [Saprolegnia diclina VS20]|eukprot:XP_008618302.1 hypothetical protein SDRG_13979 [Saprolegnia diclina VS20]
MTPLTQRTMLPRYELGLQCTTLFYGEAMTRYERAEIRRVHRDGTATVEYLKRGTTEKRVAKLKPIDPDEADEKSPPDAPPSAWTVGQNVQVRDRDNPNVWADATITRLHTSSAHIAVRYLGDGRKEKLVDMTRLRPLVSLWQRVVRGAFNEAHSWTKLQPVFFRKADGTCRSGRILRVRDTDCDIQHDSDNEQIAEHVPHAAISAKRWWHTLCQPSTRFAIQTNVRYTDAKGRQHIGVICKRHTNNTYDIQHDSDTETIATRVDVAELQRVSTASQWLASLQQFCHGAIDVGANIEVRLGKSARDDDDDDVWTPGVVRKVRADGKYMIEYIDEEETPQVVKVPATNVRRPQRNWAALLAMRTAMSFEEGMRVEVTSVHDDKARVRPGEILRKHTDGTVSVRYDDGKIDKHVLSSRLRFLASALTIGTRVDVALETDHAGLSNVVATEGVIVWVYRDHSGVVLEITDDLDDVSISPDVSVSALRLHGQRLSTLTLSGHSASRLVALFLNTGLEVVIYIWFLFGLGAEMTEAIDVLSAINPPQWNTTAVYAAQRPLVPNMTLCLAAHGSLDIASSSWQLQQNWLVALVVLKGALFAVTLAVMGYVLGTHGQLVCHRLVDLRNFASQGRWQDRLHLVMLTALLGSSLSLLCYGSLHNHLVAKCLAPPVTMDAVTTAFQIAPFTVRPVYTTIVDLLPTVAATVVFNLYRGVWLLLVLAVAPDLLSRLLLAIPMMAATAFMLALGLAAWTVFLQTQAKSMQTSLEMSLTSNQDMAISLVVAAAWFSYVMALLIVRTGAHYRLATVHQRQGAIMEPYVKKAERGAFGVRAQDEAKWDRLDQLQLQVGLVASVCIELVSGPSIILHIGLVFWLIVGGGLAHATGLVEGHPILVLVLLACLWLVLLIGALLLVCCVKRTAWSGLRKARRHERAVPRAQQYQPRVVLP